MHTGFGLRRESVASHSSGEGILGGGLMDPQVARARSELKGKKQTEITYKGLIKKFIIILF